MQGAKIFYKKPVAEQERLKLSEVKHARLAMLAIIGELTQMLMFHKVSSCDDWCMCMSYPPACCETTGETGDRPTPSSLSSNGNRNRNAQSELPLEKYQPNWGPAIP